MPRCLFLLAIFGLPLIVGCEGCRPGGSETEKEEEQAPLADFSSKPPQAFPSDAMLTRGGVKPGHWITASQAIKSNRIDSRGELRCEASARTTSILGDAIESSHRSSMPTLRPVVLPKGQQRRFDFRLLAPTTASADQSSITLGGRYLSSGASAFFDTDRQPFRLLAPEEYFFVILTNRPERFAKVQIADWVRPVQADGTYRTANYLVVVPRRKTCCRWPRPCWTGPALPTCCGMICQRMR